MTGKKTSKSALRAAKPADRVSGPATPTAETPRAAETHKPIEQAVPDKKAKRQASMPAARVQEASAPRKPTVLANPGRAPTASRATALADAVQSVLHPSVAEGHAAVQAQPAPAPATSTKLDKAKPRKRALAPLPPSALVAPVPAMPAEAAAPGPSPAPRHEEPMPDLMQGELVPSAGGPAPAPDQPAGKPDREPAPRPAAKAGASVPRGQSDKASAGPDLDALTRNMGQLLEQSSKLTAAYLGAADERPRPSPMGREMSDAMKTLGQVAEHWFLDPGRMIQAQASLSSQFLELWQNSLQRLAKPASAPDAAAPKPDPRPTDKRFADAEWHENPVFDFVRKAYLLGTDWANKLVEGADSLDEPTREKARFYLRQISSALSPSNFVPTNPELLRETIQQSGGNLVRGMAMLAEDLAAGKGDLKIRQTDSSKFQLGVNMAVTPGKVVYRNDLMELLQYSPSTETVFKRPLLIVPPWINKFYVLDLNPEKSFIRWAVSQGLTVFVVSWVNPDARHADKGFEAYMREGIFEAIDAITAATGETDVTAIGYCVGGTLLAVALAYMAARGDRRISSATLFTTQVDFGHAGDLKVFADETQIRAVEAQMKETGYLEGTKMAQAFNMLRPEELIWSYVVNNYLKGKEPMPFDLLAWNSDSTRMPAANHSFYLRNCYLENNLTRGRMEVGGERLDLGKVTIPIYNLATREDHIAPARSVFEGSRAFGGPVRYVLAGSGHIAGVVSPPAKAKYGYADGPEPKGDFNDWLAAAVEHPGSWWTDWLAWLVPQAPERVPAREPGGGVLEPLGDAPGTYVRVRS